MQLAQTSSGSGKRRFPPVSLAGGGSHDPGEACGQAGRLPHAVKVGGSWPSSGEIVLRPTEPGPVRQSLGPVEGPRFLGVGWGCGCPGITSPISHRQPLLVQGRGWAGALEPTPCWPHPHGFTREPPCLPLPIFLIPTPPDLSAQEPSDPELPRWGAGPGPLSILGGGGGATPSPIFRASSWLSHPACPRPGEQRDPRERRLRAARTRVLPARPATPVGARVLQPRLL